VIQRLSIGDWVVDVDREATAAIYATMEKGAEECICTHCADWAENREELYPPQIRTLLDTLGVDHRRETEVITLDPTPDSHSCAAWFYFVGDVVSGRMPERFGAATRIPDPAPITAGFGVVVMPARACLGPEFQAAQKAGTPLVQLDVVTTAHRWTDAEPGA
jgi:hypothetical protein